MYVFVFIDVVSSAYEPTLKEIFTRSAYRGYYNLWYM